MSRCCIHVNYIVEKTFVWRGYKCCISITSDGERFCTIILPHKKLGYSAKEHNNWMMYFYDELPIVAHLIDWKKNWINICDNSNDIVRLERRDLPRHPYQALAYYYSQSTNYARKKYRELFIPEHIARSYSYRREMKIDKEIKNEWRLLIEATKKYLAEIAIRKGEII